MAKKIKLLNFLFVVHLTWAKVSFTTMYKTARVFLLPLLGNVKISVKVEVSVGWTGSGGAFSSSR